MKKVVKVIIVAGGTLGHIKPGIAIAKHLRSNGCKVSFITNDDLFNLIKSSGFNARIIKSRMYREIFSLTFIKFLISFGIGFIQSLIILKKENPDCILGMGAFVSLPPAIAAWILGIKIFISEQNAIPGKANLLIAPFSDKIFISFKYSEKYFRKKDAFKLEYYGYPIDEEFFDFKKDKSIIPKKFRSHFSMLVHGGTRGASDINSVIVSNIDKLISNQIFMTHITGKEYFNNISKFYKQKDIPSIVIPYTSEMKPYYEASDLIICRAGAGTIFEAQITGIPTIIIPHPNTVNNHQFFNAKDLERNDNICIIKSENMKDQLMNTINYFLDMEKRRKKRSENNQSVKNIAKHEEEILVHKEAAKNIADSIIR